MAYAIHIFNKVTSKQRTNTMNQIQAYEQIKKDLELKMQSGIITMGDITALNAVNSALVDLYKQLLQKVG
jgi:hypothetical protein